MHEHSIQVTRTARYYTLGELTPDTQHVWWVLHGYGQLAKYFIRHFEPLAERGAFVIAPEGLSRFYVGSNWERVGASWMTKEDRLTEIADQMAYLNLVYQGIYPAKPTFQTHLLGFSQGTATAWRWLNQAQLAVRNLVLWAGMIPQELHQPLPDHPKMNVYACYGRKDPFFSEEKVNTIRGLIEGSHLSMRYFEFDGEHTIHAETLIQIADEIMI